jgi:ATP-binding cassette subfamily B protein
VSAAGVAATFRLLLRANVRSVDLSREAGTAYVEALNGVRSIRSMAAERFFLESYAEQIGRYVRTLFEVEALRSAMKSLPALLAVLAGIVVLWPGTDRASNLTATFFLAATTLLMRVFVALGQLVNAGSQLMMDLRAAKDINALIGQDDRTDPHPQKGQTLALSTIELKGISYGYRSDHKVLDRLDFTFCAGQLVAVVGRSGSGKSTLADLLLGLVGPDAGQIDIDGGTHTLSQLRRRVVLVEQQARLFTASVRENLQLGLHCDDAALWQALRLVDLECFVRALPGGLDALLEYQGANLSGGQRQRLAIARALIREPQVLILDEATSALDQATRLLVVRNLRQSLRERVLIFITHDTSLAAEADVVLDLGSRSAASSMTATEAESHAA